MSHVERLNPQPFDEDAYLQRVLELRSQHSPVAIINGVIDRALDHDDPDSMLPPRLERPLRAVANGIQFDLPEKEDEYVLLLARQAAGQQVDTQRLDELDRELREQHPNVVEFFVKPIREAIAFREKELRGEEVPDDEKPAPVRQLMAKLVMEFTSEEQRDDIVMMETDEYMNRLRNTVRMAAREFGLDKPRGGPTPD